MEMNRLTILGKKELHFLLFVEERYANFYAEDTCNQPVGVLVKSLELSPFLVALAGKNISIILTKFCFIYGL